jgi:hypothetical protein
LSNGVVYTGTTRYVYAEKIIFFSYKEVGDEYIYRENSSTSKILGIENFLLNMTSE